MFVRLLTEIRRGGLYKGFLIWMQAILLLPVISTADNAPVTTAGMVLNAPTGPTVTVFPVSVSNFNDIGSFSIKLKYTASVLTYQGAVPNAAFTGMTVTLISAGNLVIAWTGTQGITLPDLTVLVNLNFTFATTFTQNKSYMNWDTTACQYNKYAGGSFTPLTDVPAASYYINGVITNHTAPLTTAPVITSATAGQISVPLKVYGFYNIGSITLKLEYDPQVLTYLNFNQNPSVPGTFNVGSNATANGKRTIDISWYGSGPTLPDGSTLLTLNFNYTPATSNYTTLNWIDNGPSCMFSDMQYRGLYDLPASNFYKNGLVASQVAPQTWLPIDTSALPGTFYCPINANGFTNVKSFTLSFDYDPAVLTFDTYVPNTLLSGLVVTNNPPGTNGRRKLVITWSGTNPVTLGNGSTLADLSFTFGVGTSTLAWVTDASSCRFNDINGNAFYDIPKTTYYKNGLVAEHAAPITAGWFATPSQGQQVTVPVKVFNFNQIGFFNLTLDYDPGVVTFQSSSLAAPIAGTFTQTSPGLGRLVFSWSGSPATLADSSELFNVTFLYNGGSTPLAWYDNGASCRYAESSTSAALYDQPRTAYYINGFIGATPVTANFTATPLTTPSNQLVTFTDLTTGSPTIWNWTFNPQTVVFVDGTTSSSQSPHVKFTMDGAYSVTLIAARGTAESIRIRTNYIQVGVLGTWVGSLSTAWSTAGNWFGATVPVDTTDVKIPASARYWPAFTGDLVLGSHCRSITMSSGAQLSVSGAITIPPAKSLSMVGSGTLQIGGDWANEGIFNCGEGTLEFSGTGTSHILTGPEPVNNILNLSRTTFSSGLIALTGSTAVSGGDNVSSTADIGFSFHYLGSVYTQVRINTNGWLSLDQSGDDASSADNARLFTSSVPNTTLAPWWDDLLADGSTAVSYKTEGTAPNRIFTAEWKGVLSYNTDATARLNFQVKLYEDTDVIEFLYGTVQNGTHSASEGASTGLEDEVGGNGHFQDAATGSSSFGLTNLVSSLNWPTVNYRFTPPPSVETFYHLVNSKSNGLLNIQRNIVVKGNLIIH